MARAWWVNQGQSARLGHDYDVVWAPLRTDEGGKVSSWEQMDNAEVGDLVLHYANGAVRGFSTVIRESAPSRRPFSKDTWKDEGRVLAVDFAPLDVPIWLEDVPLGRRLSEPTPHSAFNKNGDVNQGYFYPLTFPLATDLLATRDAIVDIADPDSNATLTINGKTDRQGIATYRAEQPALRAALIGRRSKAPCGICGQELPTGYLVAAHIKQRKACTEDERADTSVAMLACLFGCDAAFERGDVRVQHNGTISVHASNPLISARIAHLHGVPAPVFNDRNKKYFAAHRNSHT